MHLTDTTAQIGPWKDPPMLLPMPQTHENVCFKPLLKQLVSETHMGQ